MATVTVGYENGTFSFTPMQTPMHAAGAIVFHRAHDQTWEFVSINGIPPTAPPTGWHQVVSANGGTLTLTDPHLSIQNYPYSVTISVGRAQHISGDELTDMDPPPIIMNET